MIQIKPAYLVGQDYNPSYLMSLKKSTSNITVVFVLRDWLVMSLKLTIMVN